MIRRTPGYVLPTVLVLIAMASLVALTALEGLAELESVGRQRRDQVRFQAAALSAEARAIYLLASEPLGSNQLRVGGRRLSALEAFGGGEPVDPDNGPGPSEGLPLYLDGRAYRARIPGAELTVAIQDSAGLLNLNVAGERSLVALLVASGINEEDAGTIAARLRDFVDADGERRLRGAEARDYEAAGLPPPANGPMRRTEQLVSVLGAQAFISPARFRTLWPLITTEPDSVAFNINTAPVEVLEARFGLDRAQATRAVERRDQQPFTSLEALEAVTGAALADDPATSYVFPNGRFRITLVSRDTGLEYSSVVILTPQGVSRPFIVESERFGQVEPSRGASEEDDLRPLEDFPTTPRLAASR